MDSRQSGNQLVFRASLKDSAGVKVTTGTCTLRLYEVQSDGDLKSYDFADNTFKTTALTTATLAMTHQQGNNNTVDTGIWTVALATLSGFTRGGVYIATVTNTNATPETQEREFIYGEAEGDFSVNSTGQVDVIKVAGTTQTARDLGASVLVSPGTGIGQLSVTSGVIQSQLANALTHGGSTAKLELGSSSSTPALLVTNSGGDAAQITSTGGNGDGLQITGHGVSGALRLAQGSGGWGLLCGPAVITDFGISTLSVTGATTYTGAVTAINAANNITGVSLATAYDFAKGTVAMTEAYAADGVDFTPAQAMYMIYSVVAQFAIAGTALTTKRLDGTTTALTFTLDSSSAPTSRTRTG